MAPHSSTLAWRVPGTGEPGGLLSTGSHRVGRTRLKRLSSSSSSNIDIYFCFLQTFSGSYDHYIQALILILLILWRVYRKALHTLEVMISLPSLFFLIKSDLFLTLNKIWCSSVVRLAVVSHLHDAFRLCSWNFDIPGRPGFIICTVNQEARVL